VFENVSVPYIDELFSWSYRRSVWQVKAHDDTSNVARVGLDSVFTCGTFVALWRHGLTCEDEFSRLLVGRDIECLTIQYLKLHEVNMQGMDVTSNVDERPDLGTACLWIFRDGFVPASISEEGP
jgi:hypothetical protein